MKAYIAVSSSKRELVVKELNAIAETLKQFNTTAFVFVDNYKFTAEQEAQMMRQAMQEIDSCDILIAELSYKAIGVGIELGYAKAKSKPVIYLRKKDSDHSTTVSGISDYSIIYTNIIDLQNQLAAIINKIRIRY
jgi:2'-deoxynucleoside 5'-phosphate N-hydrolase